jgi:superfamily II DNA or RNA helicase
MIISKYPCLIHPLVDMLTLRQYQRTAVKSAAVHFAFNQRGLLVSPAGSGKTVIAASILRDTKAGRTIWITPTQETKAQGQKACEAVGLTDVTCACKVLSMTATPIRTDDIDIEQIVGRCFYTVKRSDVMDAGGIVGASVWWVDVPGSIVDDVNRATSREVRSWMNDEQVNRVMFRHAKKMESWRMIGGTGRLRKWQDGRLTRGDPCLCLWRRLSRAEGLSN